MEIASFYLKIKLKRYICKNLCFLAIYLVYAVYIKDLLFCLHDKCLKYIIETHSTNKIPMSILKLQYIDKEIDKEVYKSFYNNRKSILCTQREEKDGETEKKM